MMARLAAALLCLLLAGCMGNEGSGAASGSRVEPGQFDPSQPTFTTSNFSALPPAAPDTALMAERERILGPGANNPDEVRLWWVGVSSFVVTMKGHLFLLDAWEIVGLHANYVPIGREELAALKPEAIFIGHGHFDHAADAGYVAGHSGAVLVAGSTVCDSARASAARDGLSTAFPCVVLGDVNNTTPGQTQSLKLWADLPAVTVLRHTHSEADPTDLAMGGRPLLYIPDVLTYPQYLNTNVGETLRFLATLRDDGGVGQPAGGTWAYHFRVGDFTLLWHDSTGLMRSGDADSEAIFNALRKLPDCVDVQLNAIVGFGMVTSAYRDALAYVAAAQPRLSMPTHHDAWAPGIGGGANAYEQSWTSAVASLPFNTEVDYLKDPSDYLKPRVFKPDDPRWQPGCR